VLIDMISDPEPEKASRAKEAMLAMTTVGIAELEQAYAGPDGHARTAYP
jgi:hypothetical protein